MYGLPILQNTFYALGSLVLIIIGMIYGEFILVPLAYAIMLAILMTPVLEKVKKYVPNHTLAFILTVFGSVLLLCLPVYLIFSQISALFSEFSDNQFDAENITTSIKELLRENHLYFPNLFDRFTSDLSNIISWIARTLSSLLIDSSTFIVYLVLAIIFAYFFTSYYSRFKGILFSELERSQRVKWREIISSAPDVVRSYLYGMLIIMSILAVLNGAVFLIVGLKYAVVWGLIIGMLAIIPYVGSIVGLLLPLGYSLMNSDDLTQPITIVICFLVIQQIEGNFLTPKIVGDKIDVNPMIIIVLMLLFGKLWGVSGVIICLPLAGIVRVISSQWTKTEFISKIMESKE
jgi:predicted PurR-regulated permease PerM